MRTLETQYAQTRARILEVLWGAGPTASATQVPSCPDWSVHDVVAHVTGLCTDILNGSVEGAATDPWTAAQVEARRGQPLADVLAEWEKVGPEVAAFLDDFPVPYGSQVVADLTIHEHDIRGALGLPGARGADTVAAATEFLVATFVHPAAEELGLPALEVQMDGHVRRLGAGAAPAGTLSVEPFELFRALTGRRSAKQVRALSWTIDPEPYLPLFASGPFTMRAVDLDE
jgi:uncharacterized protein (TIGR03083 family)